MYPSVRTMVVFQHLFPRHRRHFAADISAPGGIAAVIFDPGGIAADISAPGGIAADISAPGVGIDADIFAPGVDISAIAADISASDVGAVLCRGRLAGPTQCSSHHRVVAMNVDLGKGLI